MANPPFRVSPNCLGLPFSLSVRELKDCIVNRSCLPSGKGPRVTELH